MENLLISFVAETVQEEKNLSLSEIIDKELDSLRIPVAIVYQDDFEEAGFMMEESKIEVKSFLICVQYLNPFEA